MSHATQVTEPAAPGCCGVGTDRTGAPRPGEDEIKTLVRARYGGIAAGTEAACCGAGGDAARATRMGYAPEDLAAVPDGANLGLGCGNPQAIAALRPGETVLDLGSGAGFDCLLAAQAVGPAGQVIGIDMTHEMLARARANATKVGAANVSFRLGEIEHLPVADATVDAILSNCVINLVPDKAQVFREAFRVLKPGGRLAIADVVNTAPLPGTLAADPALLCGCVSGAAPVASIEAWLRAAGFTDIAIAVKPESRALIATWAPGSGIEAFVASAAVEARKPADAR
ncbi:MAG: arsenite methyltransferase [Acetobacteraceae bacterium]